MRDSFYLYAKLRHIDKRAIDRSVTF